MVGIEKLKYINRIKKGDSYLEGPEYRKLNKYIRSIFNESFDEKDWDPQLLNKTKEYFCQLQKKIQINLSEDEVFDIMQKEYKRFREINPENDIYIKLLLLMTDDVWEIYSRIKRNQKGEEVTYYAVS